MKKKLDKGGVDHNPDKDCLEPWTLYLILET